MTRLPFEELSGQTAVVTGGARGIGHAIGTQLQAVGMTVLLVDRDGEALEEAVAQFDPKASVRGVQWDLGLPDSTETIEDALGHSPPLRAWVNNAGVVSHQAAEDVDMNEFTRVFADNTASVLRGSQLAYRHMKGSQGSAIVNISSLAVDKVLSERLSYATSKTGVVTLTRYLAHEWGSSGIRVNCIAPGYIDTRLTTNWAADDPRQIAKEETLARLALKRAGAPSEIASAVMFLISDLAGYVTGEVVHVDGGWHLT